MGKEYFMRVPTYLGLHGTSEILSRPSETVVGGVKTGEKHVDFVLTYYKVALKVGKKFNLNPIIILAQASLESGWGTSLLATQNHNFFGITAFGKPNQYWDGTFRISKTSGLKFRNYKTVEDGFSDYARIITSYYKEAAAASNNIPLYAHRISNSPYINEKNGDNRAKYKAIIIQSAQTIIDIIKKKYQSTYN